SPDQTQNLYQQRVSELDTRLKDLDRQSTWMSRFRGLTFIPALVLAIWGWSSFEHPGLCYAVATVLFFAFIVLCSMHEDILQQAEEIKHRRRMNQIQLARLARRWRDIPNVLVDLPEQHRYESRDLDLFGAASLFQLLSLAHTPFGRETLRDWLLEPASPDEIVARHKAVRFLGPSRDFREELDLRGRLLGATDSGPRDFVRWAESPCWLANRSWLKWVTRALSVAAIATMLVALFSTNSLIAWVTFAAIVGVNILVMIVYVAKVYEIFESVSSRGHDIQHYRPLFGAIASLPADCTFFQRLLSQMGTTPHEPIRLLGSLKRIIGFANLRRSGLLGIPYFFSQMIFLTDFHVLYFLEIWQQRHGHMVRGWLQSVGQLEAISSLATLANDHPDWAMPDVGERSATLKAISLGHPLLNDDVCVRNDVEVGPAGTFLLVTGSNMSGKSTLLRAIGVNVALAQAGAPVCASEFRLPPLRVATSMRIQDSLADGVSFFMAELKRLKQIVDECREQEQSGNEMFLYLLDEILQGTNSAERHIAVSQVISHLVAHGAIGAVSTHDLELARNPALAASCQTVHFRETIVGEGTDQQMTFDYKMRAGLAPTTNALKLLQLVGLTE
ncbi:MAG: hypothetical protein OES79_08210, partial [Planctomycetota bacterium]|nr:hypothetical protein [Planctomycetota bacterium]